MEQTKQIKKDDFIEDYMTMTNKEVAAKYGISQPTVARLARSVGISKPNGRKKVELI